MTPSAALSQERPVKKPKFSEGRIAYALSHADTGTPVGKRSVFSKKVRPPDSGRSSCAREPATASSCAITAEVD